MTTAIDARPAAQRFRTMSVDGYAPGRNNPGYCLRWTYFAVMPGIQELVPLNNAVDVWNYCPAEYKHAMPANGIVPSGGVIVLGNAPRRTDKNAWKGDVYVSDGTFSTNPATDYPLSGVIGGVTHDARRIQTGRDELGWVDWLGGYPLITGGSSPLPNPATPEPSEEDNMALPVSIVPDAKSSTIFCVGPKGRTRIASPYHVSLIDRASRNKGKDKMLEAELNIVQRYTSAVS